jgi:hypothetical protein
MSAAGSPVAASAMPSAALLAEVTDAVVRLARRQQMSAHEQAAMEDAWRAEEWRPFLHVLQQLPRLSSTDVQQWLKPFGLSAPLCAVRLWSVRALQRHLVLANEPLQDDMSAVLDVIVPLITAGGHGCASTMLPRQAMDFLYVYFTQTASYDEETVRPFLPRLMCALYSNLRLQADDLAQMEQEGQADEEEDEA